jgi:hypothetical protein
LPIYVVSKLGKEPSEEIQEEFEQATHWKQKIVRIHSDEQ